MGWTPLQTINPQFDSCLFNNNIPSTILEMSNPKPSLTDLFSKKQESKTIQTGSLFAIPTVSEPSKSSEASLPNKTLNIPSFPLAPSGNLFTSGSVASSSLFGSVNNPVASSSTQSAAQSNPSVVSGQQPTQQPVGNPFTKSNPINPGIFGVSASNNSVFGLNIKREEKSEAVVAAGASPNKEGSPPKKAQLSESNAKFSEESIEAGSLKTMSQFQAEKANLQLQQIKVEEELKRVIQQQRQKQKQMDQIKNAIKKATYNISMIKDNQSEKEAESQETKAKISELQEIKSNEKVKESNLKPELHDISTNKLSLEQRLNSIKRSLRHLYEKIQIRKAVDSYNQKVADLEKSIAKKAEQYDLYEKQMWIKFAELSRKKLAENEISVEMLKMEKNLGKIVLSKNGYIADRKQLQREVSTQKYKDLIDFSQEIVEFDRESYADASEFVKKKMEKWEGQEPPIIEKPKELTAEEKRQIEEEARKEKQREEELERQRKLDQAKRLKQQAELKAKNQAERSENLAKFNKLLSKIGTYQKIVEEIQKKLASQSLVDVQDIPQRTEIIQLKSETLRSFRQNIIIFNTEVKKLEQLSKALSNESQIAHIVSKNASLQAQVETQASELINAEELTVKMMFDAEKERIRLQEERQQALRKRDSYVNDIEQPILYESILQDLKNNLNEQKYRLLEIKQHLINQIKVLIELGKLSPEELKANFFDYHQYQTLVYRKSQLVEELAAKQRNNEPLTLSQEYHKIEIQLSIIERPINFEVVKASNHYPIDLLKKTKQDLFTEMKRKEVQEIRQKRAKVASETAKLNEHKRKKQEQIQKLLKQASELDEDSKKEVESSWKEFKRDVNIPEPKPAPAMEEGYILPPDINRRIDEPITAMIANKSQIADLYGSLKDDKLFQQIQALQEELQKQRDRRQVMQGLYQMDKQSTFMSAKTRKPQQAEEDPKIKKLTEEMVQLMKQCDQLQKQKKERSRVKGVSQIRMISSILE